MCNGLNIYGDLILVECVTYSFALESETTRFLTNMYVVAPDEVILCHETQGILKGRNYQYISFYRQFLVIIRNSHVTVSLVHRYGLANVDTKLHPKRLKRKAPNTFL